MKSLLLLLFFSINHLANGQTSVSQQDTLVWSKYRLKASDFQQNDSDDKHVSFIAKSRWLLYFQLTPINDSSQNKTSVIRAEFFPKYSWIKERARGNDDVLRHEQLHFDIVELYARKLRQRLENLIISSIKEEKAARGYNHDINSELFKMQEKYDWETNHGADKAKQVWWTTNIFLQLQELEKYSVAN